ncbi:hypothetical protein DWZ40_08300 [Clostridium sp. AF32-12BH]|nr:hypothetical protein DWZ40_08300 [Clostridium sp. AF32-12BH]
MKPYSGKDLKYREYTIVNDKENKYLMIYDPYGNYVKRVENSNHGCITSCKVIVDMDIKKNR